jgi:hypothetical protein
MHCHACVHPSATALLCGAAHCAAVIQCRDYLRFQNKTFVQFSERVEGFFLVRPGCTTAAVVRSCRDSIGRLLIRPSYDAATAHCASKAPVAQLAERSPKRGSLASSCLTANAQGRLQLRKVLRTIAEATFWHLLFASCIHSRTVLLHA